MLAYLDYWANYSGYSRSAAKKEKAKMSTENINQPENGSANVDVPEIELIIKVRGRAPDTEKLLAGS